MRRRRLGLETLEPRRLLAANLSTDRFFSPAPTVLPTFSPETAITRIVPSSSLQEEGEWDEPFPELDDAVVDSPIAFSSLTNDDTFRLHSRPGSNYTIYLDFDGSITEGTGWNSSTGIETLVDIPYDRDGNPAAFSNTELSEIREIWKLVAEDFSPFDVNVTTEDPGIDALTKTSTTDANWGIRSLHTSNTNNVCSGCGGIAYVGSFNSPIDLPAYTFNKGVASGGNTHSHEIGHAIHLGHDGLDGGTAYYRGHGSGSTTWGPIMGSSNARALKTWSNGEYFNASNQQDDLDIITTQNGFSYRSDDHGNAIATASPLEVAAANQLSGYGVIERNNDIDYFSFRTDSGNVSLRIDPFLDNPNLDIWAAIYDANGSLVAESNPRDEFSASFSDLALVAGEYHLRVEGVGSHGFYNPDLDRVFDPGEPGYTGPETEPPWSVADPVGYSDYGSLGQYWITGTRAVAPSTDAISIEAIDASRKEGDSGTQTFTFRVTRSGNVDPEVEVAYAVQPIAPGVDSLRALASVDADDFVGAMLPVGIVTIPAGETTATLEIDVAGDTDFEADELFQVVLSEPSDGWIIADSTALGTIQSDETAVGIASVNTSVAVQPEGDPGSGANYSFMFERRGDTDVTTTVQWEVLGVGFESPATDPDFAGGVRPSGTVVFDPGVSQIVIDIAVAGDLEVEGDESFSIALVGATGTNHTLVDPASASRRAIIQEDESPVTLLNDVQVRWRQIRNGSGDRDAWALDNVSLSTTEFADDFDPELDTGLWQSIDNGEVNSNDSIFPGSNGRELLMRGTGDRIATSRAFVPRAGAALSFDLIIGNGTGMGGNGADNAEAGKDVWLEYSVDGLHWEPLRKMDTEDFESWTTVVVDLPQRAIVPLATLDEGDSGSRSANFSIVRSGNLKKTARVDWKAVPAGAYPIGAEDLGLSEFPQGTVDFRIDVDVQTIVIPILGDTRLEPDETYEVILVAADSGPVTGAVRNATILNDDAPLVEATILDDGSDQRSAIRTIQVEFTGLVDAPPSAFALTYLGNESDPLNLPVDDIVVTPTDDEDNGITRVTIQRSTGQSLIDGNYRLDIQGALVRARYGNLPMSDDYSFGDEEADRFYRKYGDINGNRTVDLMDFSAFRKTFGLKEGQPGYRSELNSDADDIIDLFDFATFRRNFGT